MSRSETVDIQKSSSDAKSLFVDLVKRYVKLLLKHVQDNKMKEIRKVFCLERNKSSKTDQEIEDEIQNIN